MPREIACCNCGVMTREDVLEDVSEFGVFRTPCLACPDCTAELVAEDHGDACRPGECEYCDLDRRNAERKARLREAMTRGGLRSGWRVILGEGVN